MRSPLIGIIALTLLIFNLSTALESEFEKLDQEVSNYVERIMSAYDIPGVAIGIVKGGEKYYTKGYGVKNLKTKAPVDDNTIFHMASVSKPFVATAIMQLVEAGKVDLNEWVTTYLPYFKLSDERFEEITVLQMLKKLQAD